MIPGQPESSAGISARHALFAARPLSHLSHNFLLQAPLFEALADLVHDLTHGLDVTLVVPDLARIDHESLGLLRTLFRRHPESSPSLIAGFDPHRPTPEPDAGGFIWEQTIEDVWRVATGFLTLPGAEGHDLPGEAGERPEPDRPRSPTSAPQEAPRDPEPHGDGVASRRIAAMRAAFESFAFTSVVQTGLALEESGMPRTREEIAESHALLALAAHNRQFRSFGNRRLADFLRHHLELAFEAETRPAHRSALAYRLAVTHGRRLKRWELAARWADRAIEEARGVEGSRFKPANEPAEAAILESWGRNIKSFMLTSSGRHDDAIRECEAAYRLLDGILASEPNPWQSPSSSVREAAYSRSLLADNLGAIAQMWGDAAEVAAWKSVSDRLNRHVPQLERFEAKYWIATHRRQLRLDTAAERARRGLAAARADQDAFREYRYGVEFADLLYRQGDARAAWAGFEQARDLRRRLGEPGFLKPMELAAAAAASRAGEPRNAQALIDEALSSLAPSEHDARAQTLAFQALCLARDGLGTGADAVMNQAIEGALASGERDTLLAVALAAGRACQHLGRRQDAFDAYRRAREIAAAEAENPATAAPLLALHLGLAETEGAAGSGEDDGDQNLRRCLALLPAALGDAETWWRLSRLASLLEGREAALRRAPEIAPAFGKLRTAFGQRRDTTQQS